MPGITFPPLPFKHPFPPLAKPPLLLLNELLPFLADACVHQRLADDCHPAMLRQQAMIACI